jgi:hypothetical protein
MKMKLSEFKARVKELAGCKYHSVRVSVAEYSDGATFYTWGAYIDGGNLIEARTPYEVFMRLQGESCGEAPEDEGLPT